MCLYIQFLPKKVTTQIGTRRNERMVEITQHLLGGEQDEYMGIDFHTKDMRNRAKNLSQVNQMQLKNSIKFYCSMYL